MTTTIARKPYRTVLADGTSWFTWSRTAYRRKAHVMLIGRKFACGTPTGYGTLIEARPEAWDDDSRPIPVFACDRCIAIAYPSKEN